MRLIVALIAITCAASPGLAAELVNSPWFIQETPVPTEILTVRPGDVIARSPLLPLGMATLDQDAIDAAKSEVLAPAGTEFYRLNEGLFYAPADTFPGVVYCSVAELRQFKEFLGPIRGSRLCLYDREEDRQFDGAFWKSCGLPGLPAVRGLVPKKKLPLKPLSYTVLDANRLVNPPAIALFYARRNLGGGFRFEHSGKPQGVENLDDKLPDSGELAGVRFTVLSYADGAIKVRVDQTMPKGLFGLHTGEAC